ncbi:hypothetical protein BX666DRAFT_1999452 [Dichotomocladium elegans]|nr:hypothetical protein BX666DRAFT_1999452 [Dichotomocladium elegans]
MGHFSDGDDRIAHARHRIGPAHLDLRPWPPAVYVPPSPWKHADIVRDPVVGRSVETTQVIPAGTLIKTELPIAKFLYPSHRTTHCFHCFSRLTRTSRVRCRNACGWHVLYCSVECEAAAWAGHHRVVCAFPELDMLDFVDILLALQVFPDAFGDLVSLPAKELTLGQQAALDWFCRLFWGATAVSPMRDVLAHCLGQIRCNGFGVRSKDATAEGNEVAIGKAVYLGSSMLNHACDPNALAFFNSNNKQQGPIIQIRTTRTIPQGQHVTISYGPLASRHPSVAARQRELRDRYLFTCACDACHPPPAKAIRPKRSAFILCTSCVAGRLERTDLVCPTCHQPFDWSRMTMQEGRIEHCLASGQLEEALRIQRIIYDSETAHPIGETLDRLAHLYANQGQFQKAAEFCQQSLTIVCNVFGRVSIESAEEMFKLSSLLFNAHMYKEARTQVKETIKVHRKLGLNEQNPEDFNELQAMLKFVSR